MQPTTRLCVALLLAAAALVGCAAGAAEDDRLQHIVSLRAICDDIIEDPVRRRQAEVTLNRMERLCEQGVDELAASQDRLWQVSARYDASGIDYAEALIELRVQRVELLGQLARLKYSLRATMTPEERDRFHARLSKELGELEEAGE